MKLKIIIGPNHQNPKEWWDTLRKLFGRTVKKLVALKPIVKLPKSYIVFVTVSFFTMINNFIESFLSIDDPPGNYVAEDMENVLRPQH